MESTKSYAHGTLIDANGHERPNSLNVGFHQVFIEKEHTEHPEFQSIWKNIQNAIEQTWPRHWLPLVTCYKEDVCVCVCVSHFMRFNLRLFYRYEYLNMVKMKALVNIISILIVGKLVIY